MADALECPGPAGSPDWSSLYLYRGNEVRPARPIFTGDVFFDVEVQGIGAIEQRNVLVIQHPCALRTNGLDLEDSLLVVEVAQYPLLAETQWSGHSRVMPLPELTADSETHYAGIFTSPYLLIPASLKLTKRVACMTQSGVNLVLQRWVFHNSRSAVLTARYDDVTSAAYEEADFVEDWCAIRSGHGIGRVAATVEATTWLNDDGGGGVARRVMLENRQYRSDMRRAMRKAAKALKAQS